MDPHICESPNCIHSSHLKNYKPFVPIHLHDDFSLLDGASSVKHYVKLAKEFNIPGISITNHGNATSIYQFYKTVKEAGLKPILGEEFYLSTDLIIRKPNRDRELIARDKHQTILIKNAEGYKNFCKLNYLSFTEGYYYKPRISYEMLFAHSKGLIITSGCAASIFNQLMMNGREKEAEEWFVRFVKTFGEDFYGEVQLNELNDMSKYKMSQQMINTFIIKMCNKYDIKVVIGGDIHYAEEEDSQLQDILIACQQRKANAVAVEDVVENKEEKSEVEEGETPVEEVKKQQVFRLSARHLYFHNSDHYFKFNKDFGYNYDPKFIDQCLENSLVLADKVNFEFDTKTDNYPKYIIPEKKTTESYLEELAYEGLLKKLAERRSVGEIFTNEQIEEYEKRLDYELKVINDKKYGDYFLVFWDLVKWAKANDIYCGVARGSVGGSLLSYSLSITGIDSIKFGLYFERFLNEFRSAKPDVDFDVSQGSREKIRGYLESKYGKESVFGVVTYHLYHPKSALQDASRGLGKDTSFESALMKEVTKLPDLEEQKDLVSYFDLLKDKEGTTMTLLNWIVTNQDVIYWANKMLGQCKNLGTHAGGIVITPGPIYDYIPVAKGGGEIVTAFRESDGAAKDLSELGILKLDILGLKTLNVIQGCIKGIKQDLGKDINVIIDNIDLKDPKLYAKFNKGNNVGIFQMSGGTVDSLVKAIQPDCFEDVSAINAINRPGPLESFAPVFGKWKKWEKEGNKRELDAIEEERYPFEFMKGPLKQTYGCLLYQESFMLMVCEAAGFNMGEADNFRRAIGWQKDHPKYHTVKKYFDQLETAMTAKGYSKLDVDKFLAYCRKFMGYSFNKAHATGYAYIAMQTLYLKVYYPAYFYANLLNGEENNESYQNIIADAEANGIKVLGPSITKSKHKFTVEGDSVRIGLIALKGFGDKAYEELETLELSKCDTIYEVLSKPFKKVNSKAFQCLIDSGAFDELGVEREKIEAIKALYKDPKIEKWFTRKKKALELETIPESLLQFPESIVMSTSQSLKDDPDNWKKFISELIPYVKIKLLRPEAKAIKEEAVLGFSMKTINKLSQLVSLPELLPEYNLKPLSERKTDKDLCYFLLLKKTIGHTKRGKPYLILDISDNITTTKAKCWDVIEINTGTIYVGCFKKDNFGFTLMNDGNITPIEL